MRDLKAAAALAAACLAVQSPLAAQQTGWFVQYTEPGNISQAVSAVDHDHAYIAGSKDGDLPGAFGERGVGHGSLQQRCVRGDSLAPSR